MLSLAAGANEYDRLHWRSHIWAQPNWNNSWGVGGGSPYFNHYGYRPYWVNHWNRPYGNYPDRYYRRNNSVTYQTEQSKPIIAPQRVTTSIQYAEGLKRLPDNTRVSQKDGRTIYEWQGIEYIFDWSSETYREVK
ncbi:hypothetical protein HQQ94_21335 [Shewanella sp. VB17]|nr:hypothetical protein [Shewanella sp. VB17]